MLALVSIASQFSMLTTSVCRISRWSCVARELLNCVRLNAASVWEATVDILPENTVLTLKF